MGLEKNPKPFAQLPLPLSSPSSLIQVWGWGVYTRTYTHTNKNTRQSISALYSGTSQYNLFQAYIYKDIYIYIKNIKDIQVVTQNGDNLSGGSKMFSLLCTEQSRQLPQKQQHTSEMQLSNLQSQHCNMKILILFSKYTEGKEGKRKKSTINITVRTSLNSLWPSAECTNSSQSFYYNKVV